MISSPSMTDDLSQRLRQMMDEAVEVGVDHIVLVSSAQKPGLEAYVRPAPDVVERVRASGRVELAERLARIGTDVRVSVVFQDAPLGLGHAVGCAHDVVGDVPVESLGVEVLPRALDVVLVDFVA